MGGWVQADSVDAIDVECYLYFNLDGTEEMIVRRLQKSALARDSIR